MNDDAILNSITWHLECIELAREAIDGFHPPADVFQLRMHYSLYVTNLLSTIDILCECYGQEFRSALEENLKTSERPGAEVLLYIRELRNGIVHRGIDPTSGGVVVEGVTCAVAPHEVWDRNGIRSYGAPATLLRDICIHCEIGLKLAAPRFLDPQFDKLESVTPQQMLDDALRAIETVPHMPVWAKQMARNHTQPQMLAEARTHHITKLKGLLRPPSRSRIP